MTCPGAPSLYYGDEIGLEGGRDPDCRRAMPWDKAFSWNMELYEYTKQLIAIRNDHKVLRRGSYSHVHADAPAGVYAYLRTLHETTAIVILNNSEKAYTVDIPISDHLHDQTRLQCLLTDNEYVVIDNHLRGHKIPPRGAAVLML
jgi:glycosidase